jgi:hypothetical protein
VISKLDVQLRTPTPSEEVAEPSTPWVSKTPNTVLEVQSHSKYLEERIRRHHSSSPEPLIQAIKYFKKGTNRVMHRLALVEARLKDLEQNNEIVGRRRRAKRTRLQKGGAMTVQEAIQVTDQIDVDMQVVAESSKSGGQGRSARRGIRRYGICGKGGHNARTCQVVIEASEEEYRK